MWAVLKSSAVYALRSLRCLFAVSSIIWAAHNLLIFNHEIIKNTNSLKIIFSQRRIMRYTNSDTCSVHFSILIAALFHRLYINSNNSFNISLNTEFFRNTAVCLIECDSTFSYLPPCKFTNIVYVLRHHKHLPLSNCKWSPSEDLVLYTLWYSIAFLYLARGNMFSYSRWLISLT